MNINKKKLQKMLYIYIALMCVLIFFSKTIYNFSLPKVVAVIPKSGKLTKELEVRGVIAFSETLEIYATSNGQIEEILIKKGDFIDKNEIIATYKVKTAEVDATVVELRLAVERIENQLAALNLHKSYIQDKLRALSVQSTDDLYVYQNAVVAEAKKNLERRQAELLEAQKLAESPFDDAQRAYEAEDGETQTGLQKLMDAETSLTEAQIALERAETNFSIAQRTLSNQNDDTRKSLDLELQRVDLDITRINIDLRAVETSLAVASNANSDAGIVSDYSGVVISVEKNKGQFVAQGEKIAVIGVNNNSFISEISCPESEGRFIEIGDEVSIRANSVTSAIKAIVYDITPVGDMLKISLVFETEKFTGGEYVTVKFYKQTETYQTIVPNEAVIREATGSFVWVIRSRPGALGVEYVSIKVKVLIADMDDYYTAISRGMDFYEPVAVNYNKELTIGGRISRME